MELRGQKRRLELETEYWQLLASGAGTVEVCLTLDRAQDRPSPLCQPGLRHLPPDN